MTTPAQPPLLDVENLVVGYGDRTVLDGVSLRLERGEILVVLGASGCGKSTLLRAIVALLDPIGGRVRIDGRDIHAASDSDRERILRDVGMAFQAAALLNSLTVGENVALPIVEHWHLDHDTADMLARVRLARVGLAHAAPLMPSELSGGMRKRAGMARALALEPALLLVDEPSAGLDPVTARGIDDLILSLRDDGIGCVVVTHELGSIEAIADRALMLAGGKVIAEGTLDAVRHDPHPDVQAFFRRQSPARDAADSLLDSLERPA